MYLYKDVRQAGERLIHALRLFIPLQENPSRAQHTELVKLPNSYPPPPPPGLGVRVGVSVGVSVYPNFNLTYPPNVFTPDTFYFYRQI